MVYVHSLVLGLVLGMLSLSTTRARKCAHTRAHTLHVICMVDYADDVHIQVNFLSQVRLSHKGDGPHVAKRLVDVYFALFKVILENFISTIFDVSVIFLSSLYVCQSCEPGFIYLSLL